MSYVYHSPSLFSDTKLKITFYKTQKTLYIFFKNTQYFLHNFLFTIPKLLYRNKIPNKKAHTIQRSYMLVHHFKVRNPIFHCIIISLPSFNSLKQTLSSNFSTYLFFSSPSAISEKAISNLKSVTKSFSSSNASSD